MYKVTNYRSTWQHACTHNLEYPQHVPRQDLRPLSPPPLDDYDAFTTLRLDSYTGFSSSGCSASAMGGVASATYNLLLYPPNQIISV
ncbi:hypothetical protein QL093DRAFT_2166276 [Fusarium oxysporum]|nr:hypothetical protein QL093DRAFT_2166276 [Fusarium oxysporum]